MLIIWNENFIIKNFKFHFNEWNKDIFKKKKNIKLNKKQLLWMIEKITNTKIEDVCIKSGFFDYPFVEEIKNINIGKIEITINGNYVIIKKNKESGLILYEILNLYSKFNPTLTKKKILLLLNKKKIKIYVEDPYLIPQITINGIKLTSINNY